LPLNKVLFDSTIELHLDMERVAIESRATIVKLLQNLEKELIAKVADGVSDWSKARIAKQLSEADAIIRQYYDDAAGIARDTTTSVAQVSASATATSLSAAVGGQVAIGVLPTAAYLETLASNVIVQGAIQRDWWNRQSGDTAFKFQSAVRQGLVGAETTPQIVKRVRDVMDLSRRNAETLVHTSVQSVANTSRMKVFEDNSDVISEFEYSSSLDRKTCPTCGALDNKRWVNGTNKPVNHSMAFKQPPIHFRCRCSCIPVLKTWAELGITGIDELPESTRASMFGQVTDKSFEDWLKRKTETDPTFADRTLGKGRAELWRNGKITMDQMISGGKPLSLAELKNKYL
jgi:SPP1 gp7 family putative phage head morphogenesis protein